MLHVTVGNSAAPRKKRVALIASVVVLSCKDLNRKIAVIVVVVSQRTKIDVNTYVCRLCALTYGYDYDNFSAQALTSIYCCYKFKFKISVTDVLVRRTLA